jgi:transcriptional regulator with XRE-family HTH domain
MNRRWLQQEIFQKRVRQFCKKNALLTKRGAIKMDVTADLFNLNEDTLLQFMHDRNRARPHLDTLTHIAGVLGVSVTEFVDAPSHPTPGISKVKWAKLSEEERALAVAVLAEITADDLTVEEKEELYKSFQEQKERILRLKETWSSKKS